MKIKTFEASTMEEALLQARNELGDDAVVLNAKRVKTGGILGMGGANRVELMAAVDDTYAPVVIPSSAGLWGDEAELLSGKEFTQKADCPELTAQRVESKRVVSETPVIETRAQRYRETTQLKERVVDRQSDIDGLRSELSHLSSLVHGMLEGAVGKSVLSNFQSVSTKPLVMRLGVDEEVARANMPETLGLTDPNELALALTSSLERFAQPPLLDKREVIVVVGPTGVGKTTTLAKLAAYFSLELGKSVAMVTADTFRIGAVEQLRTYARIMGIPLETAMSPDEVREGVERHRDKDVVLVDTVGRSQRNEEHMDELKAVMESADATQVLLVVSAGASAEIQTEVTERFGALSPTHLAITKLDESPNRGCLVNLPFATGLGIYCTTAGQNVPQDIDFASAARLALYVTEVA